MIIFILIILKLPGVRDWRTDGGMPTGVPRPAARSRRANRSPLMCNEDSYFWTVDYFQELPEEQPWKVNHAEPSG
jgi:hypothetical protein